jgi:hypothetical protein
VVYLDLLKENFAFGKTVSIKKIIWNEEKNHLFVFEIIIEFNSRYLT